MPHIAPLGCLLRGASVRFRAGIIVLLVVQTPAAVPWNTMQYLPPALHSLEPNSTGTDGGDTISLLGSNFGDASLSRLGTLRVHFHSSVCTQSVVDCPAYAECDCAVLTHNHTMLVIRVPPGIGVRRK